MIIGPITVKVCASQGVGIFQSGSIPVKVYTGHDLYRSWSIPVRVYTGQGLYQSGSIPVRVYTGQGLYRILYPVEKFGKKK